MTVYPHLADLAALQGCVIGTSGWVEIDQARIDQFAEATGDHQWIHVDAVRAAAGPFGATVAHGFLTLSLLSGLAAGAFRIADTRMGLNYGLTACASRRRCRWAAACAPCACWIAMNRSKAARN